MFTRLFGTNNYIPSNIKNEFIKRWAKMEKLSFREFFISIRNDKDRNWWNSPSLIDRSYNDYVAGCINTRYPKIPIHPKEILNKVVREADKMIKF